MPGFDRTGPLGEGPRTGRGLGICGKARATPSLGVLPGRAVRLGGPVAGRGPGRGGGRGGRGGRGRGRVLGR